MFRSVKPTSKWTGCHQSYGGIYRNLPTMVVLLCLCSVPGFTQQSPTFDSFSQELPAYTHDEAAVIWKSIPDTIPVELSTMLNSQISHRISDDSLFSSLTIKGSSRVLNELRELRSQLDPAIIRWKNASILVSRWERYSSALEDRSDLGMVYLKALQFSKRARVIARSEEKAVYSLQKRIQSIRVGASLNQVSLHFTAKDWIVIVGYLIFTTILGGILAGKQASIKDFFLGGRKLPWPAVCGSIMATELSAATFLIAPAIVFSKGGDFTYLQLALGTILARFIIGYFFVPVYYKREIYSPYDYMGNELGPRVKNITSILFMIGGILAQGARVYIAAKALQVITGTNIYTSIILIGVVSIGLTIMGGITTVIWTDAIQFVLFSVGAIAALIFIGSSLDGGLMTVIKDGIAAGKFQMINLNFNTKEAYTLWCGLFASGFLTLGSHGTDQLMAQRMFTCKSKEDARKAITWSSTVILMTFVLLFVGAGLYVFTKHNPLGGPEQVIVDNDSMKIFAIYIVRYMPPILSGLLMAAIFATAISTLDSILAALSQSTISIWYKPYIKPKAPDSHYVRASRTIVLFWGVILTVFAILCHTIARQFADLIQFALAMAAYTYGALLGTFLLAFFRVKRDDLGLMWGVPLSILLIFALNWHHPIAQIILLIACVYLMIMAFRRLKNETHKIGILGIAVGFVLLVGLAKTGIGPDGQAVYIHLAWPWHYPLGTAMTFFIGYLVGNRRERDANS